MQSGVAIRYVNALLSTTDDEKRRLILKKCGMEETCLDNAGGRVSVDQYARLLQVLWKVTFDESLGFTENQLKPGTFAMMCHSISDCSHLEHALRRMAKFYRLVTDDFRLQNFRSHDSLRLELHIHRPLQGTASFFIESIFAILVRFSAWLIDRPLIPQRMGFSFSETSGSRPFPASARLNVAYDEAVSFIEFPASALSEPLKRGAGDLKDLLVNAPLGFLADFKVEASYAAQLKSRWLQETESVNLGLDVFAKSFGLSPASLRRKLRDEGASFHELRDAFRRRRAIFLLLRTQKNIDAIAQALGYSESSTFHRAFKKWTGLSPSRFRVQTPVNYVW